MAIDLATIDPSEFLQFRAQWILESGLSAVGADRLFEQREFSEIVEMNESELEEYGKAIHLTLAERNKLKMGVLRLNGMSAKPLLHISRTPPATPLSDTERPEFDGYPKRAKRTRSKKKSNGKRRASRRDSKKSSHSRDPRDEDSGHVIYDPTRNSERTHHKKWGSSPTRSVASKSSKYHSSRSRASASKSPKYRSSRKYESRHYGKRPSSSTSSASTPSVLSSSGSTKPSNLEKRLEDAIETLTDNAYSTKLSVSATFRDLRELMDERETKLLHDIDTTLNKKRRMLRAQLKIEREGNGLGGDLCVDPEMRLNIGRKEIEQRLHNLGWIQGVIAESEEEQRRHELEVRRQELVRRQFECVEKLKSITIYERECQRKREFSVQLSGDIQQEISEINDRTFQCEQELSVARPQLEAAKRFVSGLKKQDLDELRALKKPSPVVELVMSAVVILLGNEVRSWKDIQKVLKNYKFVQTVLDFDTLSLRKKTRIEALKYTKHRDFNEERAYHASKVAGTMVKWVKSHVRYSELLEIVMPKKREIAVLRKKLAKKQKQHRLCISVVAELEQKIADSRQEINEMVEDLIAMQTQSADPGLDPEDISGAVLHLRPRISEPLERNNTMLMLT